MTEREETWRLRLNIRGASHGLNECHNITLVKHPSEDDTRLGVRLLAFAMNAEERLSFAGEVCQGDQPALICRDLTGNITHWIEVGLPKIKKLKRALSQADSVTIYAYGNGAEKWQALQARTISKQTMTVYILSNQQLAILQQIVVRIRNERSRTLRITLYGDEIIWQLGEMDLLLPLPQRNHYQ